MELRPHAEFPGAHDPELASLFIRLFNEYLDGPTSEYMNQPEILNVFIDNVNLIFDEY